jgi:multidrug efflux pump subunit AcrA (membrane-fusion protein)
MEKQINQERQEFEIGAKSAAQLQLTEDEYKYKTEKVRLQRQGLKHDSLVTELQRELLLNDQERERRRVENSNSRLDNLVVRAPIAGQLSSVGVVIGQQLSEGYGVAEMKVLTQYKISTSISEYYIDRVSLGLPATINYQNMNYPLKVSKVVPEIKDRTFKADLIFTDTMPDNLRVGKSYRLQIELGQPEKMLTVDRGDFIQETGGLWIYKLNESGTKATKVKIHIDRQNPSKVSIADGLREGDRVVVAGYADFKGVDELIIKN